MILPFIGTILTSAIIAYLFFPLYKWTLRKTKRKNLSASVVTILIIIIIVIPAVFVANTLTREITSVYLNSRERIQEGNIITEGAPENSIASDINKFLTDAIKRPEVLTYIDKISNSIISSLSTFVVTIPRRIISIFVMFFLLFFFVRDGDKIVKKIEMFIPLKKKYQQKLVKKFGSVTYAIIYGHFLTALVQGGIGILGLYIFGIESPLVWGIVMIIAAMIPFVGAPVIWVPLGVVKLIQGIIAENTIEIIQGVGLLLYGFIIISTIDNIIKPKIIGDRARIHPVIILLGIIGGISTFGFIGIVIGPLILSILFTFAEIYQNEAKG
jgi:predicted PurR-regulated permease PerM